MNFLEILRLDCGVAYVCGVAHCEVVYIYKYVAGVVHVRFEFDWVLSCAQIIPQKEQL